MEKERNRKKRIIHVLSLSKNIDKKKSEKERMKMIWNRTMLEQETAKTNYNNYKTV